jgi:signal transduction histidine kinase
MIEQARGKHKTRRALAAWVRRAGWAYLVLAVAAVCFMTATVYTNRKVEELGELSSDPARNALPSVFHLSGVRADLRKIDDAPDRAAQLAPSIEAHLRGYMDTAMYPEEQEQWETTKRDLDAVHDAIARRISATLANGRGGATAETVRLHKAIAVADRSLDELIMINALGGEDATLRFEAMQKRTIRTAYALDALSFTMALLAAALAYRAARRYSHFLEERTAELQRFGDRLAHDVRGPLAPALMALSLAAGDFPADHPRQKTLARGIRSLNLCATIVEGLLAFARSGAQPEPGARASVRDALHSVVEEASAAASASKIELHADPVEDVAAACSPGVLASALTNLVHNAIKFMADSIERRVIVRASTAEGRVHFEVEDTGPGLSPASRDTVFDPYVRFGRGGAEGMGLGLATVKRLVEAHGGCVDFSSRPGCTRFWFDLPRAASLGGVSTTLAQRSSES